MKDFRHTGKTDLIDAKIYLIGGNGVIIQNSMKPITLTKTASGYHVREDALTWDHLCSRKEGMIKITGCIVMIPRVHTSVERFDVPYTIGPEDTLSIMGAALRVRRQ